MEASVSQKEKIAAAKKKLKRFQQKSSRLEKVHNLPLELISTLIARFLETYQYVPPSSSFIPLQHVNGSHEIDNESQASQLSDTTLHQQTIDILVEEKAELLRTRDKQNSNIQQLKGNATG